MEFNPEFASASEYAWVYRSAGLQVVPAGDPKYMQAWKRPVVAWRDLCHEMISDDAFAAWFGDGGEYVRQRNIGFVCGACSGGVFVVDLDLYKHPQAQAWWQAMLDQRQSAADLETVVQRTGGGGMQYLFRAPAGWTPPTIKTSIGVDIRGQGGFAVLPPSAHESGSHYAWVAGFEPWVMEIAEAPRWLTEAIDQLTVDYGRGPQAGPKTQTESPGAVYNEFGRQIDDREHFARNLIWSVIVEMYRESPVPPPEADMQARLESAFKIYEARVKSRLPPRAGSTNAVLLEEEGRGFTMFEAKWQAAFRRWNDKVREEAAKPRPDRRGAGGLQEAAGGPFDAGEAVGAPPPPARPGGFPIARPFPLAASEIPPRDWLVPGLYMHGHVSLTAAPGGSGKSMLEVQKGLMVATGREWAGWKPRARSRVLLVNSEDDFYEMSRRLFAAAAHMGIAHGEVQDWLFLAQNPDNIVIAQTDPKTKAVHRTPLYRQLVETIVEQQIGLVVVDPFVETFVGDENSNSEVKWAAIAWREIARTTNAAVHLVHHTRKYAGAMAGDADAARGGGALVNASRIVNTLFTMTEEEAEGYGISADDRFRYVRHDEAKANLTLASGRAKWFLKVGVEIDNGRPGVPADEIGVLEPWEPPGIFGAIQTGLIHVCLDRITNGVPDAAGAPSGDYYTFSKTSLARYVGLPVGEILGVPPGHADRIVGAWRQSGLLVEALHTGDRKRVKKIVRVAEGKRPGRTS